MYYTHMYTHEFYLDTPSGITQIVRYYGVATISNHRSLLLKSPIKETVFFKKNLEF